MKIMELLGDHIPDQDDTQLCTFVLGGMTPWGRYKQALRELYKRVRGYRQIRTDLDLLNLDIEEKEVEIVKSSGRERRRAEIELRQLQGNLEEAARMLASCEREVSIFYREALILKKKFGEITPEQRTKLDREEWKHWHFRKAAIGKLTCGMVPDVVVHNLCSLPQEERDEWLKVIKNDATCRQYVEQGEFGAKAIPPPTQKEIKELSSRLNNELQLPRNTDC